MIVGRVIGNVWATRKDERLTGIKLLIVMPINYNDKNEKQMPLIAADQIGAGIGEKVIMVTGSSARHAAGDSQTPIDVSVVGIIDGEEIMDIF
ncbi:EutN/CcmL family microcompartment protein [Cellulosilyticum sp. I15G10I2]|uniref:EutN/CcmL family microcompartment protein n=1 Tax=Cellulosilyticum sp. I15G10I2 TaxID=1892843 RepID=UPI00085C17AC|nr:EutN/CcmL family microcompartment protein [Cellulosilyticum sp. I15G10I2]